MNTYETASNGTAESPPMTELVDTSVGRQDPTTETDLIPLTELSQRWGITVGGVTWRLKTKNIAIQQDAHGTKVVARSSIDRFDWPQRVSAAVASARGEAARSVVHDPELAVSVPTETPVQLVDVGMIDSGARLLESINERLAGISHPKADSDRVRRLLLALSTISKLAATDDVHPALAIRAVADYAIAAETS